MKLKDFARAICPPVIWQSAARHRAKSAGGAPERSGSPYHGLQDLDRKLEKFLNFDNGFFIEIGGWDGVTYSNTLYFEKCRNWRGILIEPSPSEFLKCRVNRPDARVFCCACVPFEYTEKFLPMTYCASMTIAHSSDVAPNQIKNIDEHVSSGRKFLASDETPYEFGALAKPLTSLLDEERIDDNIDLLVLDVEGFEINVLKGIDFTRHAPRYICAEVWDNGEIADFLSNRGYAILDVLSSQDEHEDILFAKR